MVGNFRNQTTATRLSDGETATARSVQGTMLIFIFLRSGPLHEDHGRSGSQLSQSAKLKDEHDSFVVLQIARRRIRLGSEAGLRLSPSIMA